jgi:hypothetical protein
VLTKYNAILAVAAQSETAAPELWLTNIFFLGSANAITTFI